MTKASRTWVNTRWTVRSAFLKQELQGLCSTQVTKVTRFCLDPTGSNCYITSFPRGGKTPPAHRSLVHQRPHSQTKTRKGHWTDRGRDWNLRTTGKAK